MTQLETVSRSHSFGGTQGVYRHQSASTGTDMRFSVFVPTQAADGPRPVLLYLSGLTCTEENVTVKGGFQRACAERGLIFVAPDTSPRGPEVPDDDAYDFGCGAGFYVDATEAPWSANYRMDDYVAEELPGLIAEHFPADAGSIGLTGHSMGGHGALTLAMRNPGRFGSLSAFAPIVAPSQVPWGQKAFTGYLGDDRAAWAAHDATALVGSHGWPHDILVDQGEADEFLETQLRPGLFEAACAQAGVPLTLRRQAGYDHSYYFIATFMADHIAWHADRLAG